MSHNVIYRLVDEVISKLSERLAPSITYSVVAEAEILKIFQINIKGRVMAPIAGCKVKNGNLSKSSKVRVVRNGVTIYDGGAFESMKHLEKPVTEVKQGFECGVSFKDFNSFEAGDIVQTYKVIEEARTLERPAPRPEAQFAAASY
jgi:translation initiation factor IF-2